MMQRIERFHVTEGTRIELSGYTVLGMTPCDVSSHAWHGGGGAWLWLAQEAPAHRPVSDNDLRQPPSDPPEPRASARGA